jgi:hypothetical protein
MTAHALRLAGGLADSRTWRWMTPVKEDGVPWRWVAPAPDAAALASESASLWPGPGSWRWTCLPRVATYAPRADARAVREARSFTIATMRRWGAANRCEDVALVVSELLTNALRHALPGPGEPSPRWPVRLGLLQPGPSVLCAVADPSHYPPVPREPRFMNETGRGLHVIARLADTWGYTPCGTGKVVWAVLSANC